MATSNGAVPTFFTFKCFDLVCLGLAFSLIGLVETDIRGTAVAVAVGVGVDVAVAVGVALTVAV